MSDDPWSPARYDRFHDERSAPFRRLLAGVLAAAPPAGGRALDLGCGTGEHTATLHAAVGARATLGIDRSPAMLARARERARPGLGFALADLARFRPRAPVELVVSNAALHWVDDHPRLIARLAAEVAPGGMLAVQVPANHAHASHAIAAEVAREEPFRGALAGYVRTSPVLEPEAYAALLRGLGLVAVVAEAHVFEHRLAGPAELVEWMRGTTLTAYERRLPPELHARFLARYAERLAAELSPERPLAFPFRRVLVWARRPGA